MDEFTISEETVEEALLDLLVSATSGVDPDDETQEFLNATSTTTFEEGGLLTNNRGIVLDLDGHQFQISIVRSR